MGEEPGEYLEAVKGWQDECKDLRRGVIEGLYEWDAVLMTLTESLAEYKDLRHERIDEAVRWVVQKAILPG